MRASWLGLLVFLGAIAVIGCRFPKLYHVRDRPEPIVYDTAWEKESSDNLETTASDDPRLQFRDTLAEPVSVTEWCEGVSSVWQLFYATNRGPIITDDSIVEGYGNSVTAEPLYGTCTVRLPHRERGRDVIAEVDRQQNDDEIRNPLIETLLPLEPEAFISQLHDMVERSRQRDVLIFVHGFNVDYDQAVLRATQVAADLPFNGAIIVYSWPSQGGVDQYGRDGEIINESVKAFTEFITQVGEGLPIDCSLNLVVHSMGNRLVTKSLWRLPDSFSDPPRFRELVFCAPDVAVDDFKRDARQIVKVSRRATVYKSANDSALIVSKWRNLDERAGESLGMVAEGIDTIETAIVDTSSIGHSYYGSNSSMLRDLFAIVKEHRPADRRPWLRRKKMPFTSADLWIMSEFPQPLEWRWHFAETMTGATSH